MLKQTKYNIADSNIANLGSELEKSCRLAAAQTEPSWEGAGRQVGIEIWRIEKFHVKPWPKTQYGSFYDGDSYIVLRTYKKDPNSDALSWNVHFWLGLNTTQDEAGTAAYKTVELDDLLGGAPVQYREVQGHESNIFLSYFPKGIRLLSGGVESGFHHVGPENYQARLLHLKGKRTVRVHQVELNRNSLNSGDCFILDNGLKIYQWNGRQAGIFEKTKAAELARALDDERRGQATVLVQEEGNEDADFWALLGGAGPVHSAAEGGNDAEAEAARSFTKKLLRLSDASGKLEFVPVAEGAAVAGARLDSNDVFVLDTGAEVIAWIGRGASVGEKSKALQFAEQYLRQFNRPVTTSISRVLEGGENEVWIASFHN